MLTPLAGSPSRLRDFFVGAGYNHQQFRQNPILRDLPSARFGNLPPLMEQSSEPTAFHALVRWFFLGVPLDRGPFVESIPRDVLRELVESGMLTVEGQRFTPAVMLTPCDGFLFASDPAHVLNSPEAANMVLWPNPSTRLLQMFTIRRQVRATLDLGTGCGILAIFAAAHSSQVVASDLNPRAAQFVAFNTWVNGVDNVECAIGDTFEPASGRTFDLIISNPPFFITPTTSQIYCENPMELDGYCRGLVRAAPEYLNEGGYLQITFEWVGIEGQAWQDRLSEWLADTGCDAWVLRNYVRSAAAYAAERIGGMMPYSEHTASQRLDEWMAYYRARHVEEIYGGILAMRRRSGRNWIRMEEAPTMDYTEPFGEAITELFANQDRLESDRSIDEMMAWKPRVASDVHLDQQLQLIDGMWRPVAMQLRRPGGLPSSLALEAQVAEFLRSCDGTRNLYDLAHNMAAVVKVDAEQVSRQCCAVVRKLVERRLLLL